MWRMLGIALVVVLGLAGLAPAQTWTSLTHQPTFTTDTALLLTDGTVMVHQYLSSKWWRLTPDNTGSYIYYVHPEWNIDWGGELLLAHTLDIPREYGVFFHRLRASPQIPAPPPWFPHLDNDDANELLLSGGFGSYVAPKPNRLVAIKGETPHAIAKVRPSAGRHIRASIGGFFKKLGLPLGDPEVPWPI